MSDTPLIVKARITMTTNITTYFRNRPPRAASAATEPAFDLVALRFVRASAETAVLPDLVEPASPPFGEEFSISISACAQALYVLYIISVRCDGGRSAR